MYQICEMCKKRDLQKDMTGYNEFFFCRKCEFKGMAEQALKEMEKSENIKYSEEDRKENLKNLERMFKKQHEKMVKNYQSFENKPLNKINTNDLNKKVEKYLELYKKSYKLAIKALGLSEIIDKLDFEDTKE
ncbi:hypothetical protein [Spiroplasma endosymbiont of Poecilobothrus nobilitatus]|uniref:hypothetical protein n=1 Tax=Spiroplasma endosymbiont of Poecilobothrus nobilitatus TaxID=1209220 RepID=UPI00313E4606